MKSNDELRNLAWHRLWEDKWFWRLLGGGFLLSLCCYGLNRFVSGILRQLNVQTWQDYCLAVLQNRQDLTTPVPNLTRDFIFQATSSGVFTLFIGYIMAGILAYGAAVILLRCLKNDENGWLRAAFGGFRDPFGMLWLFVRMVLIYFGWMLLVALPAVALLALCFSWAASMIEARPQLAVALSIACVSLAVSVLLFAYAIPSYRYRFLWLIKAEHPDWSAGACLRASKTLMKGNMLASFKLDCSYWKPVSLLLVLILAWLVFPYMSQLWLWLLLLVFAVVVQYISVGQGLLYSELKDIRGR